jgi:protoporphyrin/coproporphyrin ferrochelatase
VTSDALAPYDAVLVVSYGGPDGPDAVLPFLRNATAGRGIPDERLLEVGAHYALFGGVSPIRRHNAELVDAVGAALAARGSSLPLVVGNRNWHPYLADTLRELEAAGARRVVCLLTSAYASYSSCRQYREDIERALAATGAPIAVDLIGPYASSAGFVEANADALAAVARPGSRVLFVTHSIPVAMDAAAGPGPDAERYAAQHRAVAARVIARAASRLGHTPEWELVFCSKSSAPVPWLEPDINDRLRELAASGVTDVVAAPIGFASDHMEVVYDLDTQAAATASELGVRFARAATAGTHPAFVAELADRLVERAAVARGERPEPEGVRYRCAEDCCLSGRPGRPPRG